MGENIPEMGLYASLMNYLDPKCFKLDADNACFLGKSGIWDMNKSKQSH